MWYLASFLSGALEIWCVLRALVTSQVLKGTYGCGSWIGSCSSKRVPDGRRPTAAAPDIMSPHKCIHWPEPLLTHFLRHPVLLPSTPPIDYHLVKWSALVVSKDGAGSGSFVLSRRPARKKVVGESCTCFVTGRKYSATLPGLPMASH